MITFLRKKLSIKVTFKKKSHKMLKKSDFVSLNRITVYRPNEYHNYKIYASNNQKMKYYEV